MMTAIIIKHVDGSAPTGDDGAKSFVLALSQTGHARITTIMTASAVHTTSPSPREYNIAVNRNDTRWCCSIITIRVRARKRYALLIRIYFYVDETIIGLECALDRDRSYTYNIFYAWATSTFAALSSCNTLYLN